MTTEIEMNDRILDKECEMIAKEIASDVLADMAEDETLDDYLDKIDDRIHEIADMHQFVIYSYQALMLCAHCNTDRGDEFIDDIGFEWRSGESTIYSVASVIAYGEMRGRIAEAVSEILAEMESEE